MLTNRMFSAIALALTLASGAIRAEVGSLCKKEESTVWSCEAGTKIYSICASKDLTEASGYLQYRAGTFEKIELRYPASLKHPKGHFEFGLMAHGADLTFKNGKYIYDVQEPLIGQPAISVTKEDRVLSTLQCSDSTQSLTNNSTIELFRSVGLFK